jgi:hypothetical protein
MIKKLISEAGGINTYLSVSKMQNSAHSGWVHLKLTTTYDNSIRDTEYEQARLDMCMDPESFERFKSVINSL